MVFTSLPNSAIVETVILSEDGIINGLSDGGIIIDMSSSEPSSTRKLAEVLKERNIALLDAPVSGGPEGAAAGKLSIMVGGDESDFKENLHLLESVGNKIYYVGPNGSGHAIKAINNLLYGAIFVASCEAIALGVKAGINTNMMLEVISASAGRNFAIDVKFPNNVMPRDFNPGFSTDLLSKDMDIALSLAKEQNVPLAVSQVAKQFISIGQQKGMGSWDHTAIIQIFEDILGIEVKNNEIGVR
ncbi:2-hydroxy-3-oxopropionate reductase [Bacillus subtilis]|nr:2-hydroxy-3-oxopropionate reductase [Bacillus subtilis]